MDSIPVITKGGMVGTELLIVRPERKMYLYYDYLLTVKKCTTCLEDFPAFLIEHSIGNFNKDYYSNERSKLMSNVLVSEFMVSCPDTPEESTLAVRFGNLHVDTSSNEGQIDLQFKTNGTAKNLQSVSGLIGYVESVFGSNVINSDIVTVELGDPNLDTSYDLVSADAQSDEFSFGLTKTSGGSSVIILEDDYHSVVNFSFSLNDINLSNLFSTSKPVTINQIDGAYECAGSIYTFRNIEYEDNPIKVMFPDNENLTYTFENAQMISSGTFYKVDVFVKSSDRTFFKRGVAEIEYSTMAFDPNQSQGAMTPVSLDGDFSDAGYSISNTDISSNVISVVVENENNNSLIEVNDQPRKLFTFQFSVLDCNQTADISFREANMQSESSYIDPTIPAIEFVYIPVIANDEQNTAGCNCNVPVISSFSPASIVAGDNQILTINGSNFGVYQPVNPSDNGTGSSVLFRNGDHSFLAPNPGDEPLYIGAGFKDYIIGEIHGWTDTQIKVKVPSTDWNSGVEAPAASGEFKVRNACNHEGFSPSDLDIPYSLLNFRQTTSSTPRKLGLKNNNGNGYVFEFNSNTNNTNIQSAFQDALEIWCAITQINFETKEGFTNADTDPNDDKNVIKIEGLSSGLAGLILSEFYFQIECEGSVEEDGGFIMTDLDFSVDNGFANASFSDLRDVFLHELGHAHMLNHAFKDALEPDDGPLMHPTSTINFVDDVDITGALRVFDNSAVIIYGADGTSSPPNNDCTISGNSVGVDPIQQSSSCGTINTTKENLLLNLDIKLSPNPTSSRVQIQSPPDLFIQTVQIWSTSGHLMFVDKLIDNTSSVSLDTEKLNSGIYLLKIFTQKGVAFQKLVKI